MSLRGCCLLPLAPGLLLVRFQHWDVPWTPWKCCCHLQQCWGNEGISRFCAVQPPQTVHVSITYFFYSVHHIFFPFQLPVSPPEFPFPSINYLVCPGILSLSDVGPELPKIQCSCSALPLLSVKLDFHPSINISFLKKG